jgi:uncharacterized membrane protein YhiD involved in acid resistance
MAENQTPSTNGIVAWFKKFGGWILLGLAAIGGLVILIANFINKLAQKKIDGKEAENKKIQNDLDIKKAVNDTKIENEVKKVEEIKADMKKNEDNKAKEFSEIKGKPAEILKSIDDNFGG